MAATAVGLSGCEGIGDNPFALQIHHFNEDGPQHAAAITVSDPQIYSRESLVNDRRREAELIQTLLTRSAKFGIDNFDFSFEPGLVRDLVNYASLAVDFRAAVNPTKGAQARRSEALANAQNTQDIEKVKDGATVEPPPPDGIEKGTVPAPATATAPTLPSTDAIRERAKEGVARLRGPAASDPGLQMELTNRNVDGGTKRTNVPATPLEQFRDLQSFRAELRQALSEVNLDDLHDFAGNSLYRLQFLATVMPGRHKDKFGVARLTYLPPYLSSQDIADLYRDWLSHLTLRMNPELPAPRRRTHNGRYARLAAAKLFDIVELRIGATCSKTGTSPLLVAVPPATDTNKANISGKLSAYVFPMRNEFPANALPFLSAALSVFADYDGIKGCEKFGLAGAAAALKVASIDFGEKLFTDAAVPSEFQGFISRDLPGNELVEGLSKAEQTRHKNASGIAGETKLTTHYDRTSSVATLHRQRTDAKSVALGDAYAYATIPIERAQRVSTIARSANSLEIALALAASLPTAGASAQLGASYIKAAAGNTEALERAPLVIGFADRKSPLERIVKGSDPLYVSDVQGPQSGWVFGPPVRINPTDNTLELIHTVSSHRVATDVSLPGWWPRVRVTLETAWTGNWHDTSQVIRLGDEKGQGYHQEQFTIPLPRNLADLDAFTNLISKHTLGRILQQARIEHVEPFYFSACVAEIDFVVRGANIWRSAEVRLGGVEARQVRVLPDMEGISARFHLDDLFSSNNAAFQTLSMRRNIALNVVTRNGADSVILSMEGSRTPGGAGKRGNCVGGSSVNTTRRPSVVEVQDVSPNGITDGTQDLTFVVRIAGLRTETSKSITRTNIATKVPFEVGPVAFALNGIPGVAEELSTNKWQTRHVYRVRIPGKFQVKSGISAVPFDVISKGIISSYPIRVVSAKSDAPTAKLVLKPAPVLGTINGNTIKFFVETDLQSGKIPAHARIGISPEGLPPGVLPVLSQTAPIPDPVNPKRFKAAFEIQKASHGDHFRLMESGRKLAFTLFELREGVALPNALSAIAGTGVFYAEPDDTKISVAASAKPADLSGDGFSATFSFPAHPLLGFPALKAAKMVASASVKGISLAVDPAPPEPNADRKWKTTVKLVGASAAAFKDLLEKAKAGEKMDITFKLEGPAEPLPALKNGISIKLKE